MAAEPEIVSKQTIKPSSPTPHHLRDFKLSLLDQLAPHSYVPVLLFYSPSDVSGFGTGFSSLSAKLKASLSDVLTLYYPFCGRKKANTLVECNDAGVLYFEARVPTRLSEILENPRVNVLRQFLPFDPYEPGEDCNDEEAWPVNMAVQVSEFSCGAVGLGVCFSHKIADGTAVASFLNGWAAAARGSGSTTAPHMEAALLFPARDINFPVPTSFSNKDIVTKRLVFDGTSLSRLRSEMEGCNPTRVEAVTALIWKSAIEAARASSGEQTPGGSIASHVVDFRSRIVPPVPDHSMGNLNQTSASPLVELEVDKRVELQDLAVVVRKTIRKVDADHVSKLQGAGGFARAIQGIKEVMSTISKGVPWYCFSSWARFPFYEADFGWGKPTWVCTVGMPVKNGVTLMPTRSGEGIEAWVNLTEQDMFQFERNPELLKYASVSLTS